MAGNVWEWVQDCWHDSYIDAPPDASAWQKQNNGVCSVRVLRGGSWGGRLDLLRSAHRYSLYPDYSGNELGFRLAQN
jgi:formylglycine-generating enzyme required for sulfatase activity